MEKLVGFTFNQLSNTFFKLSNGLITALLVSSCSTIIQVNVPTGAKLIVVDAFLDNSYKAQSVRLTYNANYFSNVPTPPVLGATVNLQDLTNLKTYTFTPDGAENYVYVPSVIDTMGYINHKYQLNISSGGNMYTAMSTMYPTIPIDTILFRFSAFNPVDSVPAANKTSYYPLLLAKDIKGIGNYYWIKAYKNGVLYNQPAQMNYCEDAGLGPDGDFIGVPNSYEGVIDNKNPYHKGDVCLIEIYSINANTDDFLTQLQTQMTNSQSGLFAVTPQNVKTNIKQIAGSQQAIGWFNMAAVKSKSVVVE